MEELEDTSWISGCRLGTAKSTNVECDVLYPFIFHAQPMDTRELFTSYCSVHVRHLDNLGFSLDDNHSLITTQAGRRP